MKAFRIYYVDMRFNVGEKIYNCESPGYWSHFCASPENCVVYLDCNEAAERAAWDQKHVSPTGVERHVEEYDESRPLVRHKRTGLVRDASLLPYLSNGCSYEMVPAIGH